MNFNTLFHISWIALAVATIISVLLCFRRRFVSSRTETVLRFVICILTAITIAMAVVRISDIKLNDRGVLEASKSVVVVSGKLLTYDGWLFPKSGERKLLIHSAQFDRIETPQQVYKYLLEDLQTGEHLYVRSNDKCESGKVLVLGLTTIDGVPASSMEVLDYSNTLQVLQEHGRRFAPIP